MRVFMIILLLCLPNFILFFFPSDAGVISSIGVDGSGYKQFKAGPDLIISFTYTENILFWVTQGKGEIRFALMRFQTPCLHFQAYWLLVNECI